MQPNAKNMIASNKINDVDHRKKLYQYNDYRDNRTLEVKTIFYFKFLVTNQTINH